MAIRKSGKRYPLLFYRRTMDRVWNLTLFLCLVLGTLFVWNRMQGFILFSQVDEIWMLVAIFVSLGVALFALFSRWMAYVQVHPNYLSIVTPFLRLKIAHRRIISVHPSLLQQIFPLEKAGWAESNYLSPFYGKTAILVEMRGYPMNPVVLKWFLPKFMFSPRTTGLVLLTPDWMQFSTEIDTFRDKWQQAQGANRRSGR